jgi:hypothetical protein
VAVLHYAGAPNANPPEDPTVNLPVPQLMLNETDLHVSQTVFFSDLFIDEVNFPAAHSLSRGKISSQSRFCFDP